MTTTKEVKKFLGQVAYRDTHGKWPNNCSSCANNIYTYEYLNLPHCYDCRNRAIDRRCKLVPSTMQQLHDVREGKVILCDDPNI